MATAVTEGGRAVNGVVDEIGEPVLVGASNDLIGWGLVGRLTTAGGGATVTVSTPGALTLQGQAVVLSGSMATPDLVAILLGTDIDGSRIEVIRRPPGGGAPIDELCAIEGANWTLTPPSTFEVTWNLVSTSVYYWILEDPVYGKLDVTTRPGF